jgi:hypothetical protein
MASLDQIGTVTTRSGGLIAIDTGYLGIWSHNAAPLLPEGSLDTEEQTSQANGFVDLRIVGSGAERAGQLLDMSWNPLFVYDQPPAHPELEQKLREVARKHHLDARFEVISPRIPHRRRINQALEYGRGAGEIQFHGVWAAVVSGVPVGESLPVLGERMPPPETVQERGAAVEEHQHTNNLNSRRTLDLILTIGRSCEIQELARPSQEWQLWMECRCVIL